MSTKPTVRAPGGGTGILATEARDVLSDWEMLAGSEVLNGSSVVAIGLVVVAVDAEPWKDWLADKVRLVVKVAVGMGDMSENVDEKLASELLLLVVERLVVTIMKADDGTGNENVDGKLASDLLLLEVSGVEELITMGDKTVVGSIVEAIVGMVEVVGTVLEI
jgi:hypothetical protein